MNVAGDCLDVDGNASSSKASSCGVAAGEDAAGAAGLANCVCCSDPGSWPDVEGVTAAADCSSHHAEQGRHQPPTAPGPPRGRGSTLQQQLIVPIVPARGSMKVLSLDLGSMQ